MQTPETTQSNAADLALVVEARNSLEHLLTRADLACAASARKTEDVPGTRLPIENDALKLCVASAQALLRVSEILIDTHADAAPQARAKRLEDLVAHTKVAGRSAYRAALLLTDTQARLNL